MMMKITTKLLLLVVLLSTSEVWGIGSYAVKDTLHVMTISGLTLRKSPKINAGARGVLPYGTAVVVTGLTSEHDSVAELPNYSIKGSWVKVQTPKGEGFVFDGYLTRFQAPKLTNRDAKGEGIEAYIQERYRAKSKKMPASKNPQEFNQAFSQGIKYSKRIAQDSSDYGRIMIEEISLEEMYLIANVLCRTSAEDQPNYSAEGVLEIKISENELNIMPASGEGLAIKAVKQKVKGGGGGGIIQYKMLVTPEASSEETPPEE